MGEYTYLVKSDFYSDEFIDEQFKKRGNWQKITDKELANRNSPNAIDFIYLDSLNFINPKYYNLQCRLKNAVDDTKRDISLKHNLMENLAKLPNAQKFIMPQITLDLNDDLEAIKKTVIKFYDPKKIYIFKPITGMSGAGIYMINNRSYLIKQISKIQTAHKHIWNKKRDAYIKDKNRVFVLQEYITNPYLIEIPGKHREGKYKFHIRHYFLYQPRPRPSFYKKVGEVAIAKKPYIKGEWNNKDIHDTHFRDNFFVDQDELSFTLDEQMVLDKQIDELYQILYGLINSGCYSESQNCFEIFGLDIIVCDDLSIKLIEVNSSPGLDKKDIMFRNKKELFEGIMNIVVDSHFQPAHKQNYNITDYFKLIKPRNNNKLTIKKLPSQGKPNSKSKIKSRTSKYK